MLESEPQIVKNSAVSNLEDMESETVPPKQKKRRKKNHDKQKQIDVEKSNKNDKNDSKNDKIEINGNEELFIDTATPRQDIISAEQNAIMKSSGSNAPKLEKLTKDEEDKLLDFDETHHGEPKLEAWKLLVQELNKDMKTLQTYLKKLKKKNGVFQVLKNSRFSLIEDKQILDFIDGLNIDLKNPEALKSLRSSDFVTLAQVLNRNEVKIYEYYHDFILPTILATFYSLSRQWENNLVNYIINDIVDWQRVLVQGSLTKSQISKFIFNSRMGCKGQSVFLYQEITAHRNKIPLSISICLPKWIEERKGKIIKIYESIVKEK